MKIGAIGWSSLAVSGLLALLAWAAPMLVILGFFFLILPGLVLLAAPTAFVYLATTLAIREFLPISSKPFAAFAAVALAFMLGWAVVQPFRIWQTDAYHAELANDVKPNTPVELSGHIRVEYIGIPWAPTECDYVCASLLERPSIKSVTLSTTRNGEETVSTYALVSAKRDHVPGQFPTELAKTFTQNQPPIPFEKQRVLTKALMAKWALRLSTDHRIVTTEPVSKDDADWTLRCIRKGNQDQVFVQRVEAMDASGLVRVRQSTVQARIFRPMFYFGFDLEPGVGTINGASFQIGQKVHRTGDKNFDSEAIFKELVGISFKDLDPSNSDRLSREVARVLDDPDATAAELELPNIWLSTFQYDAKANDFPLIKRILDDGRIKGVRTAMEKAFYKKSTPSSLREALAHRILMSQTTSKDRSYFAHLLSQMPASTFAEPAPSHLAIWTEAGIASQTTAFLARTKDLAPPTAVSILLQCLESSFELDSNFERRKIQEAIQDCFIEMGPNASEAIPQLVRLFGQRDEMFFGRGGADRWRFVLACMGMKIANLPLREFELQQPSTCLENMQNRLRKRMERHYSTPPRSLKAF